MAGYIDPRKARRHRGRFAGATAGALLALPFLGGLAAALPFPPAVEQAVMTTGQVVSMAQQTLNTLAPPVAPLVACVYEAWTFPGDECTTTFSTGEPGFFCKAFDGPQNPQVAGAHCKVEVFVNGAFVASCEDFDVGSAQCGGLVLGHIPAQAEVKCRVTGWDYGVFGCMVCPT